MAHKKITIDLNGGDSVTANADLKFQILGSATEGGTYSILPECTYAKLGSANSAGTDAAVTFAITGDVAVLDHVDIGTAAYLKYQVQDEAGNESVPSVAKIVAGSSNLVSMNFTAESLGAYTLTNIISGTPVIINDNGNKLELDGSEAVLVPSLPTGKKYNQLAGFDIVLKDVKIPVEAGTRYFFGGFDSGATEGMYMDFTNQERLDFNLKIDGTNNAITSAASIMSAGTLYPEIRVEVRNSGANITTAIFLNNTSVASGVINGKNLSDFVYDTDMYLGTRELVGSPDAGYIGMTIGEFNIKEA